MQGTESVHALAEQAALRLAVLIVPVISTAGFYALQECTTPAMLVAALLFVMNARPPDAQRAILAPCTPRPGCCMCCWSNRQHWCAWLKQ
jgi:hypothetical protein